MAVTRQQQQAPRYSRERWEQAQQTWRDGEPWSEEWRDWRHLAAQHGIPDAPEGSQWDQWDDPHPSQRAMLIRAIRETPALLSSAIRLRANTTWGSVIETILHRRDARAADVVEERGSANDPSPEEAAKLWARLKAVLATDDPVALAARGAGYCPTCKQPLPERSDDA